MTMKMCAKCQRNQPSLTFTKLLTLLLLPLLTLHLIVTRLLHDHYVSN